MRNGGRAMGPVCYATFQWEGASVVETDEILDVDPEESRCRSRGPDVETTGGGARSRAGEVVRRPASSGTMAETDRGGQDIHLLRWSDRNDEDGLFLFLFQNFRLTNVRKCIL